MKSLTWLALFVFLPMLFSQAYQKRTPDPNFSELSPDDSKRLEQQRKLIADAIKERYGAASLTETKSDLPLLQRLIDDHVFSKSQTYELQSLGVAFGDVLTSEFPLRWVMITDEHGTDPTLRFKNTSINVNALTMISKRIERDERVDVFELVRKTGETLSDAARQVR